MKKFIPIISAILIFAFFSMYAWGATIAISLGINDSVVPPPKGVRPTFVDNVYYVPADTFSSYFSISNSYDGVSRTLTMMAGDKSLSFNIRQNIAVDQNKQVYYFSCYYENSVFMVPAKLVCDIFGLKYSYLSMINTIRIRLPAANLTDAQFVEKYKAQLIPIETGSTTPGTPSITPPDVPDVVDSYLIFAGQPNTLTGDALDSLAGAKAHATFFIDTANLHENPAAILDIISGGHEIGIDLSASDTILEYSAQDIIKFIREQNHKLALLYKVNTNALFLSAEQYDALDKSVISELELSGFSVWNPTITADLSVYSVTSRLLQQTRGAKIYVPNNEDAFSKIYAIKSFMTKNEASFLTIKLTTKP